ncbi:palmitoyltransferase AKR1 [Dendrothele bispora CBS 962.96]|uniref:Palmitoyltransferase n=1 Tax=Dendrothele bispora (strain CBS 962.96) TaxID=1314807 RepID=A0A4S8MLE7_DENBC|nr:palmitoyltransferase AKR1 [Dendrothele bispora CBS 962.96]
MDDPTALVSAKSEPAASSVTQESAVATNLSFSQEQTVHNPEANIFVAAQRGDVELIKQLIESGQAKATDRDEQNITPLHWAAINAQIAACRSLLDQGAEVDALGGDLVATPMQWAARNGYLYIIQLLIAHNADPTIADSQGYNTLHLVTHSSSIMPLLYLLHQPINVDSRDAQGHTSLMWAAYQGDALSVDLLLRHGANPNTKDDAGLTPLHWAVVRANRMCIRRLVEHGADLTVKDAENRTARDMAVELKSLGAWKRAMEEGGMNEYGVKRTKPFSDRNTKIAIFLLPTIFFYLIFTTLAILPWYTGVILAMAEFFGMHHIVTRVLLNKTTYTESVNQTPYFAGIIFGSILWVLFSWFTRLVQHDDGTHSLAHLGFAISAGLCMYNFSRAVMLDPGTCPKPSSDGELKTIIEDLASEGRLNGQTFCIQCMARKPLRSKHCRVCDKCIARSDHHCPWVWNCVGSNNHRQFVLFVTMLVSGIMLFDYLTFEYFSSLELPTPDPTQISPSCMLPINLCQITAYDTFLVAVSAWATLQLSWTIVLLISQYWQIARQMTTLEVSNLGRYGFMGGRGGASVQGQMGHRHGRRMGGGDTEDSSLMGNVDGDVTPSAPGGHGHQHGHSHGCCGICGGGGFLMNLLGFDRFTKGKAVDGLARASKASNPFDMGVWGNCKDFWTAGKELGVEYDKLYDVPFEGFVEAKKRREREEEEEGGGAGHGRKGSMARKGLFMGLVSRMGGSSRGQYEPISQV